MKTCPHCAKETQDEATTCECCGEWLKRNEEAPTHVESPGPEPASSPANEDVGERAPTIDLEPAWTSRWGWGWLVLLAVYASGTRQVQVDSNIAYLADTVGFVGVFAFYYFLRRKIAKRWNFTDPQWLVSFAAGFVAYVSVALVAGGLIGYGNARWSWTRGELEKLNNVASDTRSSARQALSRVNEIEEPASKTAAEDAIANVKNAQSLFDKSLEAYDDLKKYFEENKHRLSDEEVATYQEWFGVRGETFAANNAALRQFYDALAAFLEYRLDNYDALQSGDAEQTAEYEALRSSCERAMTEYNQTLARHRDFVREYLVEHPKVAKLVGAFQ